MNDASNPKNRPPFFEGTLFDPPSQQKAPPWEDEEYNPKQTLLDPPQRKQETLGYEPSFNQDAKPSTVVLRVLDPPPLFLDHEESNAQAYIPPLFDSKATKSHPLHVETLKATQADDLSSEMLKATQADSLSSAMLKATQADSLSREMLRVEELASLLPPEVLSSAFLAPPQDPNTQTLPPSSFSSSSFPTSAEEELSASQGFSFSRMPTMSPMMSTMLSSPMNAMPSSPMNAMPSSPMNAMPSSATNLAFLSNVSLRSFPLPLDAEGFSTLQRQAWRTTILPRVEAKGERTELVIDGKERYQPRRRLGEGAMGEVQLAFDQDIQRPVALKRLKADQESASMVMRFAEEIRVIGQLEHPNIVPIHDVGLSPDGQYYFVMKFVDGETLEEVIERLSAGDPSYHQRFPFATRVQIFLDILKAIAFAHDQGILHRDIKPANIMIGRHGEVLVMDWGIAKRQAKGTAHGKGKLPVMNKALLSTLAEEIEAGREAAASQIHLQTHKDRLIGTPAFMSPEQATGQNHLIDERSDIYSLCVLFHEFLSLHHYLPPKSTLFDLLYAVATEPPRPAFVLRHPAQGIVPIELSHFISKGLSKDPEQRFASVHEMQEELARMQGGYIKVQCPTTLIKRAIFSLVHFVERFPSLSYALIVGLSGLLMLLLVSKLLDWLMPS